MTPKPKLERHNVIIEKTQMEKLKDISNKTKHSVSSLIRLAIEKFLQTNE